MPGMSGSEKYRGVSEEDGDSFQKDERKRNAAGVF